MERPSEMLKKLEEGDPAHPLLKINGPAPRTIYHPLSSGTIRTVTVRGGQFEQQISCSLSAVSLADKPHFEALSYVWGDQTNPCYIILNGEAFEVTHNLNEALRHLRQPTADRILWIDALCINQSDIQERNVQVRQMYQIYARADLVLAWLGPSKDNSVQAMEIIQEAERHDFAPSWMKEICQDTNILANKVLKVSQICLRDYWGRVWIVQELAHARDVVLICGLSETKYTSLISFTRVLNEISSSIPQSEYRMFFGSAMTQFLSKDVRNMDRKVSEKHVEMIELTDMLSQRHCRDRRDKIYGIHSLLNPKIQQRIPIDYSRTVAEVYVSAARAAIETSGRLDSIIWIATPGFDTQIGDIDEEVPSWVPNWTLNDMVGGPEPWVILSKPFCADGGIDAFFKFDENGTVLHAKGVKLGVVQESRRAKLETKDKPFDFVPFSKNVKHIKTCFDLATRRGPIDTNDFFMTWMGGLWHGQDIDQGYLSRWRSRIVCGIYEWENKFPQVNDIDEDFDFAMGKILSRLLLRTFLLITSGDDTGSSVVLDNKKISPKPTMGLASRFAQPGDIVTVLLGCSTPVILRPVGSEYTVVGDVYILGFMSGEAVRGPENGTNTFEDFHLC